MICKNCGNVLFGNEAFCPACGAKCEKIPKKSGDRQGSEAVLKSPVKNREGRPASEPDIFSTEPVYVYSKEYEAPHKEKKKTSGVAVAFLVTFIITVLGVGGFIVADYLGLVPALAPIFNQTETKETNLPLVTTTLQSDFSDADGIVPPQISFKPVLCFVSSQESLSLRKGPDDSYAQLTSLSSGTQVQVIGGSVTQSEWVYIYVPTEDCYGWLCSSFLSSKQAFEKELSETGEAST